MLRERNRNSFKLQKKPPPIPSPKEDAVAVSTFCPLALVLPTDLMLTWELMRMIIITIKMIMLMILRMTMMMILSLVAASTAWLPADPMLTLEPAAVVAPQSLWARLACRHRARCLYYAVCRGRPTHSQLLSRPVDTAPCSP